MTTCMNVEEEAVVRQLRQVWEDSREDEPDQSKPPENIRLTPKRWLEAVEDFVREHPGAIVRSVDNPEWLMLGWVAYATQGSEEVVMNVTLPLYVRTSAPGPFRTLVHSRFERIELAKALAAGATPSTELP